MGDGWWGEPYQLIYADHPDQIRAAAGPWLAIARSVEQAMAVLEDGQRKLAQVWRSPAGQLYVAEMDRLLQAMRATSEAARHNDRVLSAAADALDARQKDYAVLARAPIPSEAQQRYAQAILNSLDESYQQAIADFQPIQVPQSPVYDVETPIDAQNHGQPSYSTDLRSARPVSHADTAALFDNVSESRGDQSSQFPNVPTRLQGNGPNLQGISPTTSTVPGPGPTGIQPAGGPGTPGTGSGTGSPSTLLPGADRAGWTAVAPNRPAAGGFGQQPGGQTRALGRALPAGSVAGVDATTSTRPGPNGPANSVVGSMPVGGASGGGQSWCGYRRPAEPFPISRRHTAPPVIGQVSRDEEERDEIATDYEDDLGNRITIRRPRD